MFEDIPDRERVVECESGSGAGVANVKGFHFREHGVHECGHPFCKRGVEFQERRDVGLECGSGEGVGFGDIEGKECEV